MAVRFFLILCFITFGLNNKRGIHKKKTIAFLQHQYAEVVHQLKQKKKKNKLFNHWLPKFGRGRFANIYRHTDRRMVKNLLSLPFHFIGNRRDAAQCSSQLTVESLCRPHIFMQSIRKKLKVASSELLSGEPQSRVDLTVSKRNKYNLRYKFIPSDNDEDLRCLVQILKKMEWVWQQFRDCVSYSDYSKRILLLVLYLLFMLEKFLVEVKFWYLCDTQVR